MNLILTLDYELFGNGSGNVYQHVVNPTGRLLKICDKYGIRITIFFEVLEYIKIKETWKSGISMGYESNPAEAIENQIIEAHQSGHDIQLHLHPQWLNAEYEDSWSIDPRLWRLPEVSSDKCGFSISELLKYGREIIEDIIRPLDSEYRCNIFRAGGHNILPSAEVVNAMQENYFIADSSVFPGGFKDNEYSQYDFRGISREIPYWWIKNGDVREPLGEGGGIMEIPIFSLPIRNIMAFDIRRIRTHLRNREHTGSRLKKIKKDKEAGRMIRYYLAKRSLTWDFSLLSFRKMLKFYNKAQSIAERSKYDNHPFVLIGHSKEFLSGDVLDRFFKEKSSANFITLTEFVKSVPESH